MESLDKHGRIDPPLAGNEAETLLGFLDFQRATLAWKCSGVDAAGFQTTVGASTMTLGGMLKHLALVEHWWFARWLDGDDESPRWEEVQWREDPNWEWPEDPDWDWHSAAEDTPRQLLALWRSAADRSRALTAQAISDGGLSMLARRQWPDGSSPSLRWILCHMIEEYARHNGHADLIREAVDGVVGE